MSVALLCWSYILAVCFLAFVFPVYSTQQRMLRCWRAYSCCTLAQSLKIRLSLAWITCCSLPTRCLLPILMSIYLVQSINYNMHVQNSMYFKCVDGNAFLPPYTHGTSGHLHPFLMIKLPSQLHTLSYRQPNMCHSPSKCLQRQGRWWQCQIPLPALLPERKQLD